MDEWSTFRNSIWAPEFLDRLAEMGVDQQDYDEFLQPQLEEALEGVSLAKLDENYPPLTEEGHRLILTDEVLSIPPLRIMFHLESDQAGEHIVWDQVDLR